MKINSTRNLLTAAFKTLRSEGYFARQNFWCCQSCGWNAIPEHKSSNAVFYHRQDRARLDQTGKCFISWAGDPVTIRRHLEAAGLTVTHDGKESTRFEVSAA